MTTYLKIFVAFLFSIFFSLPASNACTIFIANDGRHVWIGNNEDEVPSLNYRLWYFPALKKSYGYMIWTELSSDEKTNSQMYKNPQGGMNTKGLFVDYTAIDEVPAARDPKKTDRETEVATDILKQCKTVDEALQFISQFNLVRLTGAQLFISDASGDYATVHGSYIVRRATKNFALTNYSINNEHHEACWRRDLAKEYLRQEKNYQLQDIVEILQKTAQKKPSNLVSNYSMAAELKKKTIHLYYKNDFALPFVISLHEELKKGKHFQDMQAYFPKSVAPVILEKYTAGGIDSALTAYDSLRKYHPHDYNLKNNDAIELAAQAIAMGHTKDGIRFLERLKAYYPEKLEIDTWLATAYRKEGRIAESDRYFAKALAADPDNYAATLFGKQHDQTVTFTMNDFEGAEQVSLTGDFSNWAILPMQKEKGRWTCTVSLPKGEYRYKFIVNGLYLADQLNLLYAGSGPDIYSILYVW
ncbi:AMP-activated protein kinase-like protein [Flavobacterium endophyticum]|uniref:AMP-activated protein kinase-like protein n=1 Tax=Flavobacterium endophyticum TaxID=1540163 RepID=A0A495MGD5_9FLAO|nr:hypothetical protein [Flavobacterium endophyticum]RKS25057.1 AMP-activated protein kinase-like protein [Flavobacterium endophyticum]